MKSLISFFLVLGCILLGSSCKKNSDSNQSTSSPTTLTLKFENQSDLNNWIQSAGGEAIIDSESVKFQNIIQCFHFETVNLISVESGKSYILKVTAKVNHSIEGDPGLCVGDFMIYVIQGSTYLVETGFGDHPNWTTISYSFKVNSSASIKIKFLIGTTRGAWINKLELSEI